MALIEQYGDDNRVTDTGLVVTYAKRKIYGDWTHSAGAGIDHYYEAWEWTRYARKSYRYVGMSRAAAEECRDDMIEMYTRDGKTHLSGEWWHPNAQFSRERRPNSKENVGTARSTIKRNCVVSCFPASASGFWIDEFRDRRYAITEETWDVADNVFEAGQTPAGWKPLPPLSEIGVYESPLRASWPVVHAVNVKYDKFFPWARKRKAK